MSGLNIPAAPGYNGWTRLKDGAWKTMKASEIAEVSAALAADIEACGCKGKAGPTHATTYVHGDSPTSKASAHSYVCRSGSRHFNPNTRQMEGRAHCTCDYCY